MHQLRLMHFNFQHVRYGCVLYLCYSIIALIPDERRGEVGVTWVAHLPHPKKGVDIRESLRIARVESEEFKRLRLDFFKVDLPILRLIVVTDDASQAIYIFPNDGKNNTSGDGAPKNMDLIPSHSYKSLLLVAMNREHPDTEKILQAVKTVLMEESSAK